MARRIEPDFRLPTTAPLRPMSARTGLPVGPGLDRVAADRSMRILELAVAGATFAAAAILGLVR